MSDMASILGLILLAFTWLALRGMGNEDKPRRPRRRDDSSDATGSAAGPSHHPAR